MAYKRDPAIPRRGTSNVAYILQQFDHNGDPFDQPRTVAPSSQRIPKEVRILLQGTTYRSIELHFPDGTSMEITKKGM
jgi:hypothetical protein